MKIDNSAKTIGSVQGPGGSRVAGPRPSVTSAKAASPSTGQTTTVVSTALHAVGGAEAAFDSQRVAEIRQAISEGRFQINPERIADGLISSVRDMLGRNRQPT